MTPLPTLFVVGSFLMWAYLLARFTVRWWSRRQRLTIRATRAELHQLAEVAGKLARNPNGTCQFLEFQASPTFLLVVNDRVDWPE